MALSRLYSFDGPILVRAINATFVCRESAIQMNPAGLERSLRILKK